MAVRCDLTKTLYFPIPKVACTSLKRLFWELNTGEPFPERPALALRLKRFLGFPVQVPKIQSQPGYETSCFDGPVHVPDGFETFAVVRDPVGRLVSAWSNKVNLRVFALHGETEAIQARGLPVSPSFSEFVEHFEHYKELSRPVRRHTRSFTQYLGSDIGVFDRIFKLEEMRTLERYLSERAGCELKIPVANKSDKGVNGRVDAAQVENLRRITSGDYRLLAGYYRFEDAVQRYFEGEKRTPRAAALPLSEVTPE